MSQMMISRRQALVGTAAVAGIGALGGLGLPNAEAKPMRGAQAPYFYRFRHGQMQITVVSDGPLPLGDPSGAFLGVSKQEIGDMLSRNFLPPDNIVLEQNAVVVNTGSKLVLFDSGMGTNTMLGKTTGRLLKSLREAAIDPRNIDAVVVSHGHIDHLGGLVGAKDVRLFPNAQIFISQADFDFWTDESKPAGMKDFIARARKNLLPYRDRTVFIKDGQEILPGIQAMAAPGHTVGHMVFMITSNGKSICNTGDLANHPILAIERPLVEFAYDTDGKQAAQSRVRILDMLASQKIPLLAYHFPWPGVGHVAKQGDGFRYVAQPMQMLLETKS